MQRHPMPRLSEKNACPIAPRNTLAFTFSHSGFNRNSTPVPAPGNDKEHTASMSSKMNSIGIMIFADFSIPFSTPLAMMKWVESRNKTNHTSGRQGLVEKVVNELM